MAEKNLAVDLFYKQREKLRKDSYIKHVQGKLENTIEKIEKEDVRHREKLLAEGGIFADDLVPAKNPLKESPALSSDDLLPDGA